MKTTIRLAAAFALLLFIWYLVAARVTPYTSNARLKAIVVDVVPQVSGYISALAVTNSQVVEQGALLARIDQRPFLLQVEKARNDLQLATQEVGASSADVAAAQANVSDAQVKLANSEGQSARIFELEKRGVASTAQADNARAQLASARSHLAAAEANLEKAKQSLGDKGADNPQIRTALANLKKAELDLEWTELHAPERGAPVDLTITTGTYAKAGQALMTFVSFDEVWVEAYLTENNLALVAIGNPVEITLDLYPGRIFKGVVSSLTFAAGISHGAEKQAGDLPKPPSITGWMRDPQRFPLRIKMLGYEVGRETVDIRRNLNGQADVIVYTSNNWLLNALGAVWIRLMSWFSYAY